MNYVTNEGGRDMEERGKKQYWKSVKKWRRGKSKKGNTKNRERERKERLNPSRPNHLLTLAEHFALCSLSLQASVSSTPAAQLLLS